MAKADRIWKCAAHQKEEPAYRAGLKPCKGAWRRRENHSRSHFPALQHGSERQRRTGGTQRLGPTAGPQDSVRACSCREARKPVVSLATIRIAEPNTVAIRRAADRQPTSVLTARMGVSCQCDAHQPDSTHDRDRDTRHNPSFSAHPPKPSILVSVRLGVWRETASRIAALERNATILPGECSPKCTARPNSGELGTREYDAATIVHTATDQHCHILDLLCRAWIAAAVVLPQNVPRVDAFGRPKD
ncbi:hypothetical protein BM43_43 [Burkholderia gladioli]|uniref:Uncharacterized protein n=1 Tax=Burkholderia gladioli TaxID=28095 RepID=A0AAW3EWA9_BURGA|nr:hypothetical protein BM43_43 [Burkholderia gladioli]KGC11211.1 hypothetical protein DM48_7290 [Burkholderia gladioli]